MNCTNSPLGLLVFFAAAMGHEHVVEAMGHKRVVEAMGHKHVVEAMGHEHVET